MKIQSFFQISLNPDQQNTIEKLEEFLDSGDSVFLLKGYAGTGKTTLIKGLIDALKENKKNFVVCAPTGRAAKILRNKTGYGSTIHSAIYDFDNLVTKNSQKKDVAEYSFEYFFPLQSIQKDTIVIVDEASMISSKESKNELFNFGTNVLLDDLLTFSRLQMKDNTNKMIVIGDPAQLAPVGDNTSWALESKFYEQKEIPFQEVFLTHFMRQGDNLILENASRIRKCIDNPNQNILDLSFDEETFINYNNADVVEKYCEIFPVPNFNSGVIINFSNAQNYHYNKEIRKSYFPDTMHVAVGDVVQIISNNYHKYDVAIYNGEFAKIIEVGEQIKQSAPVYVDEAGKRVRKIIEFSFRKVVLQLPDFAEPIPAFINETLLESTSRDLNVDEMKAVYINAVMRFKIIYPKAELNSELFKNFLKSDDFYNAVRVKYGYSITGHKSQGGEWETIFVDYFGRASMKKDPLRWCYTATTRASKKLFAINYPKFGKFQTLNFSLQNPISKIPQDAMDFSRVPCSPFHKETDHKCKSLLYWTLLENCEDTTVEIKGITSSDYLEKYTFDVSGNLVSGEVNHKLSGHFSDFKFTEGNETAIKLVQEILKKPSQVYFPINYHPSDVFLLDLYKIVQASCNDLGIRITNVVEHRDNYFVNYFFETDSICSQIQFYFNGKELMTKALVKAFENTDDPKLQLLIQKISEYASVTAN